ncbi:MAG: BamA/TamA family outer membrane protein [Gemmatimonadota bacterium]|nr:BamA/TamA family outer membrane protein [Gemmatimonadota bacterium]
MRFVSVASLLFVAATAIPAQQPVSAPTGHSLVGLPSVNFDADEGFGYGAQIQYYDYGYAGERPYRYSLQPAVFFTTRGRRDVTLFLDAPHMLPGDWRLGAQLAREQQITASYYGVGNNSVNLESATAGANPYYYRFGRTVLRGNADFQHSLGLPALRVLLGVAVRNADVKTVPYDSGTTLLAQQVGKGTLPTVKARLARVGLVFDTRDKEIGPEHGNWSELLVQRAGRTLGGDQVFTRITGTVRQYVPLTSSVTFAERVVLQTVHGDPAISEIFVVQSSFRDDEILGGATSIRGIPKNRYVGKGVAFSNSELRWAATSFNVKGRNARLILSAFADAGRVWADGLDISQVGSDLHVGYGGGARVAVGPSFVVAADVGHSSQSTAAIYLGLGYLF